jgi:hypothetical protein
MNVDCYLYSSAISMRASQMWLRGVFLIYAYARVRAYATCRLQLSLAPLLARRQLFYRLENSFEKLPSGSHVTEATRKSCSPSRRSWRRRRGSSRTDRTSVTTSTVPLWIVNSWDIRSGFLNATLGANFDPWGWNWALGIKIALTEKGSSYGKR